MSLAALALACGLCALRPASAGACTIPVFRFAMERWPAGEYRAVVFHRGPLTAAHEEAVAALSGGEATGPANVRVTKVDLSAPGPVDPETRALWKRQENATEPWLVLHAPHAAMVDDAPVYAGPLDAERVKTLVDSPARRELAARLLKGESAVWLLLEGGDRERDDAAAALLSKRLAALQKELRLPGVPAGGDAGDAGDAGEVGDADAPPGPALLSAVPLTLRFSVLRVSPDDPAERRFAALLRRTPGAEAPAEEPVVIPVFGRGRALCGLAGDRITAQAVGECAAFMAGACSCQVKELNPGVDLLVAADWDSFLNGSPEQDPEPPAVEIPDPVIAPGEPAGAADQ